ncbi:MAG: VWA domain-containing protein [Planctomycetes bacterium]|nr:VWA domain-containing protein [Planctomycetota bacterium]
MHVLQRIAESLLGIPRSEPGQGVLWHFQQRFPWPTWALVLFAVFCSITVFYVYQRDAGLLRRRLRAVLAGLRLTALGLVLFMLSESTLSIERTGLPYVVVLLDQSGSMATEDATTTGTAATDMTSSGRAGKPNPSRLHLAKSLLTRDNGAVLNTFLDNHKLRIYATAESLHLIGQEAYLQTSQLADLLPRVSALQPQGDETRLGDSIRDILNTMRGSPPSAIVIFSDGIVTDGEKLANAARLARQKSVPLFFVAMGNAEPIIDLELHNVLVDDVAFVNDPITFTYSLTGHGLAGKKTRIALKKPGEEGILASQEVTVADDGRAQKLELTYTPTVAGDTQFILEAVPLAKEFNIQNNSESRNVSIRDEKIRVLLADLVPRWEFRELKALLEREKTIELKTVLQDADPEFAQEDLSALPHFPVTREELDQYDIVIFGDLNLSFMSPSLIENLRNFVGERGRGVVFIAGPYHNPVHYRGTPLETLLPVDLEGVAATAATVPIRESFRPEMTAEGRKGTSLFRFADNEAASQDVWNSMPGFFWAVETRGLKPGAIVLAVHPTQTTPQGKMPIMAWQRFGNGKVMFHATDELWRWRFRTGDTYYGRYWVHLIRYLSRSKLLGQDAAAELTVDHKVYRTGEIVELRVRFADEKQAAQAHEGVTVIVERTDGAQQKIVLAARPDSQTVFEGQISQIAEGRYHAWIATPSFTRAPPAEDFEVRPSEREMRVLRTDLAEMTQAAKTTGGKIYTPALFDTLADDIPVGLPVAIESNLEVRLWNHWLTLLLFALVLSTEWILRKRWRLV